MPSLMDYNTYETARLYINQDDGTFTEGFTSKFGSPSLYWVSGVHWVDIDNDDDLDAVFSAGAPTATAQRIFINDAGQFTEAPTGLTMVSTGVRVLDSDLDGLQDLLFLPGSVAETPHLLNNITAAGVVQFADVTSDVGLSSVGRVDGAVVSDFNAGGGIATTDGDLDIYFGRPDNQAFFFQAKSKDGTDAPEHHYVSLRLLPNGANNASAIGTKVTASYPGWVQVQQVDGGSGRGGQDDHVLTFGLGDYSGTVGITIEWPGGHIQTENITAMGPALTSPVLITDSTSPAVLAGTLYRTYTLLPSELLEWTLTWDTAVSSKWVLDTAYVEVPGAAPRNKSPSIGNATAVVTPITGGGYRHVLKFTTECVLGFYKFKVRSSVDGTAGPWSGQIQKKNNFCPSGGGGTFPGS